MKKNIKTIIILSTIAVVIIALFLVACNYYISFRTVSKDTIDTTNIDSSYIIDGSDNNIYTQNEGKCAQYSVAYVLRNYGIDVSGNDIKIRNFFKDINATNVCRAIRNYDLSAKVVEGNLATLKAQINQGNNVIAYISIDDIKHFVVVTGYDEEYVYLVDSIIGNANVNDSKNYNRKMTLDSFESIWLTDTYFASYVYIVISE